MFNKLFDWLGNRALRLSHAATVQIAKKVSVSPETIEALNDKLVAVVLDKAAQVIVNSK